MSVVECKFFEAFKLIECEICRNKYCSLVGEINYPANCADENHKHVKITAEIREKIEEIILKEYVIFKERYAGFYSFTARPVPDDKLGCDEAYYMVSAQEESYSDTLLALAIKLKGEPCIYNEVRALFKIDECRDDGTSGIEL